LGLRLAPDPFDPFPREAAGLPPGAEPFPPDDLAWRLAPLARALAGVDFGVGLPVPDPLRRVEPALGFEEEGGRALAISRSLRSDLEPEGPFGGMALVPVAAAGGGPATMPRRNSTSCVPMRMALEKTK
jgi:hypothetical protein